MLVQVWRTAAQPEFYIFSEFPKHVEEALGPKHSTSESWTRHGSWNTTTPGCDEMERMHHHKDRRVCFEWWEGAQGPSNVEIVDYH